MKQELEEVKKGYVKGITSTKIIETEVKKGYYIQMVGRGLRPTKKSKDDILNSLKPCPFCGSFDLEISCYGSFHVECKNCDTIGPGRILTYEEEQEQEFWELPHKLWNERK